MRHRCGIARLRAPILVPILVTALLAASAAPAAAQDAADARTATMIARQKQVFGPPPPKPRCGVRSSDGEIVVCAPDDGAQWRVPSTADSDPTSRAALRDGMPRAPQLDRGSCRGQPGCIVGGWAPPPVYMIDLDSIPEAPEGSDADKVAKGEMQDR